MDVPVRRAGSNAGLEQRRLDPNRAQRTTTTTQRPLSSFRLDTSESRRQPSLSEHEREPIPSPTIASPPSISGVSQADFSVLQTTVKKLYTESLRSNEHIRDLQEDNKQLRTLIGELQGRVNAAAATGRQSQLSDDLHQALENRLNGVQAQVQTSCRELAAMETRLALLDNAHQSTSRIAHDHATQLKDGALHSPEPETCSSTSVRSLAHVSTPSRATVPLDS